MDEAAQYSLGTSEVAPVRLDGGQGDSVRRDAMRLDVIGVAVAAELVIRHQHLRPDLPDDRDQPIGGIRQVSVPKRVGAGDVARHGVSVRAPLHA